MSDTTDGVWGEFSGLNAAYLLDLYELYLQDPASVDAETRALFERSGPPPQAGTVPTGTATAAVPLAPDQRDRLTRITAAAVELANAIRSLGHRAARLDPLGTEPPGDFALYNETYGITDEDLASLPGHIVGGAVSRTTGNALQAIQELRSIYQGSLGYEFEHVSNSLERDWLREAVEVGWFCPPNEPIDELKLLERLTEVGAFERFLHSAFPGKTRFSLEGLGMMVPLLDEVIGAAAEAGTRCVLIGMAHRGRLNVLAHTLNKPYDQLVEEFLGYRKQLHITPNSNEGWTGDVKYHLGARRAYQGGQEVEMSVLMVPNPSHLEWVNPVVVGMDRAADEERSQPGPARQNESASMSVLIHGDAAFPGQGIVAETLNLSRLPGYRVGGVIHLIANNQLGFTTSGERSRSTLYSSDLAKGFEIPVIHVNADDPLACIVAARLAHAYRERFHKDVLIDLVGYRRWGHNEGDEPTFTQPLMYAEIAEHPTVRELWSRELVRKGLITEEAVRAMLQTKIEQLHAIRRNLLEEGTPEDFGKATSGLEAGGAGGGLGRAGAATEVETTVPAETLSSLNEGIYQYPEGFRLHSKLEKLFGRRREMSGRWIANVDDPEAKIEWAHAEALAFASIISESTPIRITGQDVGRGTFSHRHAVLYDSDTGARYIPLQSHPMAKASFEIWDSPLSECATLGFEFGYSVQAHEALVLWEAQYGDFVNVPQVIIDQFIVSARHKWDQHTGMVMLLPHGYEGQGPEHSSARLERFLQMAAEDNMRIANCSTAAQYFHILRRQARLLSLDPRPLILMTPKSLLRNPLAASPASELTRGGFQPVLDDPLASTKPDAVRRLVLCSGKVYYDLVAARTKRQGHENGDPSGGVALARVEELYPFPARQVGELLQGYPNLEEVVWLQEEPRNMGAWIFVAPRLRDLLQDRLPLRYIGRTRRASPSEGSFEWHVREQERLVGAAFWFGSAPVEESVNREVEHVG